MSGERYKKKIAACVNDFYWIYIHSIDDDHENGDNGKCHIFLCRFLKTKFTSLSATCQASRKLDITFSFFVVVLLEVPTLWVFG